MNFNFKRTLSIVLTLLLMLGCCVPAFADGESGDSLVDRDTVLLLDNSVSMYGDPLEYTKQAAIKFCKQLFEASNSSRVAIVVYDTNVVTKTNFTTDINYLTNTINSMDGNGSWTNIYSAVVQADKLLQQESDASIKNMVIMTDGAPTAGEYTDVGPYTYQDYSGTSNAPHYVYQYANALYNGVISLHSDYNVYTLGFFHNMYEDQKAFASRVLNDIQNTKYYDVTDADDLEFTFGEVAEDIVKDNYPIIIVHGIMGGRFFNDSKEMTTDTQVWDPPVTDDDIDLVVKELKRLGITVSVGSVLGNPYSVILNAYQAGKLSGAAAVVIEKLLRARDMDSTLYQRPIENQQTAKEREYGALSTYKHTVDSLCEAFPDREIYFFSYDWRKSSDKASDDLRNFIKNLDCEKVDIVAHSMGGLVTASCVKKMTKNNEYDKINKIITCGTPYEGAPVILYKTITHNVLDSAISNWAMWVVGGMTQSVKAGFKSCAELTPTKRYCNLYPMQKDSWAPFGIGDYDLEYDAYVDICKNVYGDDYSESVEFQNSLLEDGVNILTKKDNTYFIIGKTTSAAKKTITKVKFNFNTDWSMDNLTYGDGDGTVPLASATVLDEVKKLDGRYFIVDLDHTETINSDKAVKMIINILSDNEGNIDAEKEPESKKYMVIRIACPVDVKISKDGEVLQSDLNNMIAESSFGRIDYLGENNEVKMFCLEDSDEYIIDINGTAEGTMDYELRWINESGELVDNITFTDVPITEDTLITTDTDNETDIVLNIDDDGDGEVDEVIEADEQEIGRFDDVMKKIRKIFEMIIEIIEVIMNVVSTVKG